MAWYIHQDNGVGVLGREVGVQGWGWDGGAGWPWEWEVLSLVHLEETLQPPAELQVSSAGRGAKGPSPSQTRGLDATAGPLLPGHIKQLGARQLAVSLRPCDPMVVVVGGWCSRKKFILVQWLLVS